ncbi:MAG: TrmH family RNA methyltransferase [Pseudomonadota bacterium]
MSDSAAGPVFILVRPQMGENIGAAARALWNFGLDRMRVVAPRDGWPNARAAAMASGAGRVLDAAWVTESTAAAAGDLNWLAATTARPRELTMPVLSPAEAAAAARARIAAGETVGFLFGPERAGLENDDIARANAIVSVPVNPAFPSLNLAQCVLLLAYEWGRAQRAPVAQTDRAARAISQAEAERFYTALTARLDAAGYFWPEDKRASMQANLRNLVSRLPLTDADLRTLYGVVRTLDEPRLAARDQDQDRDRDRDRDRGRDRD